MTTIGERVRAARKGRNMSQTDLARLMSDQHPAWMQSTVWKIETDQQHLKGIEVPALSAILLKSVGWLISGDDDSDRYSDRYSEGFADGVAHVFQQINNLKEQPNK